jgi:hypothetical protein
MSLAKGALRGAVLDQEGIELANTTQAEVEATIRTCTGFNDCGAEKSKA